MDELAELIWEEDYFDPVITLLQLDELLIAEEEEDGNE